MELFGHVVSQNQNTIGGGEEFPVNVWALFARHSPAIVTVIAYKQRSAEKFTDEAIAIADRAVMCVENVVFPFVTGCAGEAIE